jgi:(p)ppGpp synthase/HD superfamily hydrolase
MHQWFDILTIKYGLTNGERITNPWNEYFEKGEPVVKLVPVRVGDQQFLMKIELSTKEMNIMPIHLLTSESDLSESERDIAESKLEFIRNDYQQAALTNVGPAEKLESIQQGLGEGGKVRVFDPDHEKYSVPRGATYLDVAYVIGPNLGNTAESVMVTNGGNDPIPKNLTDLAQPGDICSFVAPKRRNSREAVLPSRFDMVITPKAIREIYSALITRRDEIAVSEDARKRGSRILQWLYEKRSGKRPDILFDHIFDQDESLVDRYKNIRNLKRAIGYHNSPSQQDRFYDFWQNELQTKSVIADAFKLVDNLIDFRRSVWGVRIFIKDQPGVISSISDIVASKGGSIFPMKVGANEEEDQAEIEIIFVKGNEALVNLLKTRLSKKYKRSKLRVETIYPEKHPKNGK